MSKSAFEAAKLSSGPFSCLHCCSAVQQEEISSFKDSVDNLLSRVLALEFLRVRRNRSKKSSARPVIYASVIDVGAQGGASVSASATGPGLK